MARSDDKLRMVRLQIIDEITGEPLEYVNVRTNAKSVSLSDGTFLEDVIKTMKTNLGNVQVSDAKLKQVLEAHLNSSLHADASKLQDAFIGLRCDKETGVVTFLRYDGTTFEWDTTLEHIPLDIKLDKKTNELVLVTDKNPTGVKVDLSKFVDVFEGEVTDDTTTKVTSDKHIIVHLNKKGVKMSHLSEELQEFVTYMNDFLTKYEEKIEGIEEGANNYVLPPAKEDTLGGIKPGFGLTTEEDGTTHTTNVMIGETVADAKSCGMFLQVCNVGGASTDIVPTMENETSYITSEGNIITYVSETGLYTYQRCSTDGHTERNLTKAEVEAKLFPGLELVELSDVTWYICETELTREYAVLPAGDGFIYDLSTGYRIIIGYIDTKTFLKRFNAGELVPGRRNIPEPATPTVGDNNCYIDNTGSIAYHYVADPYLGDKDCYEYWDVADDGTVSLSVYSSDSTIENVKPLSELATKFNDTTKTFTNMNDVTWYKFTVEDVQQAYAVLPNGSGFLYSLNQVGQVKFDLVGATFVESKASLESAFPIGITLKDAVFVDTRTILFKNITVGKSYYAQGHDVYWYNNETNSYDYANLTSSGGSSTNMPVRDVERAIATKYGASEPADLTDMDDIRWILSKNTNSSNYMQNAIWAVTESGNNMQFSIGSTSNGKYSNLQIINTNSPDTIVGKYLSMPYTIPLVPVGAGIFEANDAITWSSTTVGPYITPVGNIVEYRQSTNDYAFYGMGGGKCTKTENLTKEGVESILHANQDRELLVTDLPLYTWYSLVEGSTLYVYALNEYGVGFKYATYDRSESKDCNIGSSSPVYDGESILSNENAVAGSFMTGGFISNVDDPSLVAGESYLLSNGDIVTYDSTEEKYTYFGINDYTVDKYRGLTRNDVRVKMFPNTSVFANMDLVSWYQYKSGSANIIYAVAGDQGGFKYTPRLLMHNCDFGSPFSVTAESASWYITSADTTAGTFDDGFFIPQGETKESRFADATSYFTSKGGIIEYKEDTGLYTHVTPNASGALIVITDLTKDNVKESLADGTTLAKMSELTWYAYPYEGDIEYVVAKSNTYTGIKYAINAQTNTLQSVSAVHAGGGSFGTLDYRTTRDARYESDGVLWIEPETAEITISGFEAENSYLLEDGHFTLYDGTNYAYNHGGPYLVDNELTERKVKKAMRSYDKDIIANMINVTWYLHTTGNYYDDMYAVVTTTSGVTPYCKYHIQGESITNVHNLSDPTVLNDAAIEIYNNLLTAGSLQQFAITNGGFVATTASEISDESGSSSPVS